MRDPYNPGHVLAPHHDGSWRLAILLSQHRDAAALVLTLLAGQPLARWRDVRRVAGDRRALVEPSDSISAAHV